MGEAAGLGRARAAGGGDPRVGEGTLLRIIYSRALRAENMCLIEHDTLNLLNSRPCSGVSAARRTRSAEVCGLVVSPSYARRHGH